MRHFVSSMALGVCGLAVALGQPSSRLRADLEFLTSDALAGRLSLTPQAEIAARYIAADFRKTGLAAANDGSYLQEFPLIAFRSDAEKRGLVLTRKGETKSWRAGADFTGSFYREVGIKAPVVFVGFGITAPEYHYDDYAGVDATGKIVLMFDHEPEEDDPRSIWNGTGQTLHAGRWTKVNNARRHGAIGVLIASEPVRKHAGLLEGARGTGQPLRGSAPPQSLEDAGQIPAFSISDGTLAELLVTTGRTPAEWQQTPRAMELPDTAVEMRSANTEQHRGISLNAVGLLEGSDPVLKSETLVVSGHYDHLGLLNGRVYPGANDNASGTVAVMELARMFAQGATRPRRSLLFVVFGSEEELMLGSFYYTSHPLRPLAGTRAAVNLDMIARDEAHIPQSQGAIEIAADTSNVINLVGTYYSADLLKVVERGNRGVGLKLETKLERDHVLNTLFRCDHLPFLEAGIAAVWLFGGFHPGYHEPSDTVEKLNFPKMEKVIRLAYEIVAEIANADVGPRFGAAVK
jgi:Peptidase family M28/PA domain